MSALRRITQETFDEAVEENVREFEMPFDEALQDAIKQFQQQNVDLSEIDKSGGVGKQEVLDLMDSIKVLVDVSKDNVDKVQSGVASLERLSVLCADEFEHAVRNQKLMNRNGGMNTVLQLLDINLPYSVVVAAFSLLLVICKTNVANRDFFEPGGSKRLCAVLKSVQALVIEQPIDGNTNPNEVYQIILLCYKTCVTVAKSERNKSALVNAGVGDLLIAWLEYFANLLQQDTVFNAPVATRVSKPLQDITTAACNALRELCVHDDIRKDMSCAFENGRLFLNKNAGIFLLKIAGQYSKCVGCASSALAATKQLILTEESVQVMALHGAMELPKNIFTGYLTQASNADADCKVTLPLLRAITGVMRNLCADDIRKTTLAHDGTLLAMLAVFSNEECWKDVTFAEHTVACLAMMSLRSPGNSSFIMNQAGVSEMLVNSMYYHLNKEYGKGKSPAGLLRQGSLFFRNVSARCPEQRENLLKNTNVENVLKQIGVQFPTCVDEAYSALRDLGVDIKRVKVNEDGSVSAAFEAFGSGISKGCFKPVYDDKQKLIMERIQEEDERGEGLGAPYPATAQMMRGEHSHSCEDDDCCDHE